jgi:hypothetical protein
LHMPQVPAQNRGQVLRRRGRARSVRARNKEIRLPQRDLQPEAGPAVPRMRHMEEWLRQKSDRLVHQRQGIGLSYVRLWLEEDSLQEKQAPLPVSQPKARGLNPDLKFVADIPYTTTTTTPSGAARQCCQVQPWRFTGETRTATVPGRVMWIFDQVQYPATEGASVIHMLLSVIHILLSRN